ncbi:TolC family protein [Leptospira kobayashii]|uniref:TolC family protein n=1 Tax=Leptospira kobayashii TaxID=1917830 RepID=UPI001FA79086|nr:TolC family protein [Leptospira kobayashii]
MNAFGKDSLNYPGFNTYTKGSMGVDIPLYEGGSGRTLSRIQEKKSNALFWEKEAQKERDYIQSAFFYRGVESLNEFIRRTEDIKKIETRFRSNYQFANKSNPVGYSGYLALKGLDNRLSILITQTNTQSEQFKNNLAVLSGIHSEDLRLVNEDLQSFLNRYFPLAPTDESSLAKAMSSYVEGETFKSDLEASKFLPRIGFYSEANTYNGSRNTQTAYNAGVYLQMNLYNPKDIGVIEEAKLNAEAFQKKLEEVRRQEDLSIRNLRNQEITLNENYLLLKESLKLQEEQTSNMLRLFQTGVVSAIQFTESLNRTTDISKSLLDVELELIRVRTEKYLFQKKEYVDVAN